MKHLYLMLIILCAHNGAICQSTYYWSRGKKVAISTVLSQKFVLIQEDKDTLALRKTVDSIGSYIKEMGQAKIAQHLIFENQKHHGENTNWAILKHLEMSEIRNMTKNRAIKYEAPFYTAKGMDTVCTSHLFYVKLKKIRQKDTLLLLSKSIKLKYWVKIDLCSYGLPWLAIKTQKETP